MTRTIPTLAVLMAATLLTAAAANAQEARGAQAFPPGPNVDATAYPPGPTAQAGTNTTTNVNVVNAPTVQVGNEVAVKEPVHTPLYVQKYFMIDSGSFGGTSAKIDAPLGTRMVVETVSLGCTSTVPQGVGAQIFKAGLQYGVVALFPPPVAWGSFSFSSEVAQVRLLVDDSLSVSAQRATSSGVTYCTVNLVGYTTPMP